MLWEELKNWEAGKWGSDDGGGMCGSDPALKRVGVVVARAVEAWGGVEEAPLAVG